MAALVGHAMAVVGDTTSVHTAQSNPIGMKAQDADGNTYIYAQGVASLAAGDWVRLSYDGTTLVTTRLLSSHSGPVAIAMAAVTATTSFGWFQVAGRNSIALIASDGTIVSAGGEVQATESLAARVKLAGGDSFGAATGYIYGAWTYSAQPDSDSAATGTPGADMAYVYLNFPYMAPTTVGYSSTGASS